MNEEAKLKISIANSGCNNGCYKHGKTGTLLHKRWIIMRRRVKSRKGYENIKICKEWNNFETFEKDMGDSFYKHVKDFGVSETTIDRIDNLKGYDKKNCRWSTIKEQANNRSTNVFLNGKTLKQFSESNSIPYNLVCRRSKKGRSIKDILSKERLGCAKLSLGGKTLAEIAKENNISYYLVYNRWKKGRPLEGIISKILHKHYEK